MKVPNKNLSKRLSEIVKTALINKPSAASVNRPTDVKGLAYALGMNYQSLSYWLSSRNNIPAFILPAVCQALDNYEPIELLAEEAGYVAFPRLIDSDHIDAENVKAIQRLVEEVGDALKELATTLADDIVEDHELPRTIKELHDIARECSRLEHWLIKRSETDRLKARTARSV